MLTDEHCLTVNRMPVALAGRPPGAVVTLRDRTELSGLLRELDSVRGLTDALRAQQHEFSNRMHTHRRPAGARRVGGGPALLTDLRGAEAEFAESVRVADRRPLIVGLILAKAAVAAERGVELELTEDTWLGDTPAKVQALTTILGNLVDNAFDAVVRTGRRPSVQAAAGCWCRWSRTRTASRSGSPTTAPASRPARPSRCSPTASPPNRTRDRCAAAWAWRWSTGWCSGSAARSRVSDGPGAVFLVHLPTGRTLLVEPILEG